jgi:hypothetical protein
VAFTIWLFTVYCVVPPLRREASTQQKG